MGFYHTLKLDNGKDIGGYSKGGSKSHWFFAFEPEEFQHSVQEALLVTDIHTKFIGYVTTVGEALQRLSRSCRTLEGMNHQYRHPKDAELLSKWEQEIYSLEKSLRREDKQAQLILNQTDGFEYACIVNDSHQIIGFEQWAFLNDVQMLWNQVYGIKQRVLTFEEWLIATEESIPDEEIPDFDGDLAHYIAHEERSYGPNPVTIWYLSKERRLPDNPRKIFRIFCEEWPAYCEKENLEGSFSSQGDPYGQLDCLIYDCYTFLQKYKPKQV